VSGGSLTIVGTGIQIAGHLTPAAREAIESADVVLAVVTDPVTLMLLQEINPSTRSLHGLYEQGRDRRETYAAMTEEMLREVRDGKQVCAAFYGHPGVFVDPSHRAVAQARAEGYPAELLPAISAEDCLLAELGVDPADDGCLTYEATDFLTRNREVVPTAALVLWQIGTVGNPRGSVEAEVPGLPVLVEKLLRHYPPDHVTAMATLYVPPLARAEHDPEMVERLGLSARSTSA
jgi:uncharacterized protein YabN with tetrapyrrole methylase and pyrophosphatase domain